MIISGTFHTHVFGYVVTTNRYHDAQNRVIDLYLTTIKSIVPASCEESFTNFRKTSMSLGSAIKLHYEAVNFVDYSLTRRVL